MLGTVAMESFLPGEDYGALDPVALLFSGLHDGWPVLFQRLFGDFRLSPDGNSAGRIGIPASLFTYGYILTTWLSHETTCEVYAGDENCSRGLMAHGQ